MFQLSWAHEERSCRRRWRSSLFSCFFRSFLAAFPFTFTRTSPINPVDTGLWRDPPSNETTDHDVSALWQLSRCCLDTILYSHFFAVTRCISYDWCSRVELNREKVGSVNRSCLVESRLVNFWWNYIRELVYYGRSLRVSMVRLKARVKLRGGFVSVFVTNWRLFCDVLSLVPSTNRRLCLHMRSNRCALSLTMNGLRNFAS